MKARMLKKSRDEFEGDILVETVVWELPDATKERPHRIKYRLYCGRGGKCLVRYDNETGKGDHRHYETGEEFYQFTSFVKLVDDFLADVERLTGVRL